MVWLLLRVEILESLHIHMYDNLLVYKQRANRLSPYFTNSYNLSLAQTHLSSSQATNHSFLLYSNGISFFYLSPNTQTIPPLKTSQRKKKGKTKKILMDLGDDWKEMKIEKIVPTSRWTYGSNSHSLQIHVPGFKESEVWMSGNTGIINVHGERQVNSKIIHFEESYIAPNDSYTEEASPTFKDGVLYINIPRKVSLPELQIPAGDKELPPDPMICPNNEGLPKEEESNVVKKISKQVMKCRTEIILAVIAFSLGVLVSHGYQRGKGEKRSENDL